MAFDSRGDAIVVTAEGGRIEARVRVAGGTWRPAQRLASHGSYPDVAVDRHGRTTAVWATSRAVQAAVRPAGGRFAKPFDVFVLPPCPNARVLDLKLAVGPQGDAVAAWLWRDDGVEGQCTIAPVVMAATRARGSQRLGQPQRLGSMSRDVSVGDARLDVGVNGRGDAAVVWESEDGTARSVFARRGRAFDGAESIPGSGGQPRVALDARGDVVVVSIRIASTEVVSSLRRPPGRWMDLEVITNDEPAFAPRLVVDGRGTFSVAWWVQADTRCGGPGSCTYQSVQASSRLGGGGWSTPEGLSHAAGPVSPPELCGLPCSVGFPALDVNSAGALVATWTGGAGTRIEAAVAPENQVWLAPATVRTSSGCELRDPQVALDAQGNAIAVWQCVDHEPGGKGTRAEYAAYDGAGPQLRDLRIPTTGLVGSRVRVTVNPVDVWTRTQAIRWTFGDGTQARGARASHTYESLGRHVITVTAIDTRGHVTSARRLIRIVARP